MSLSKFLRKLAPEMSGIGGALLTLAAGVGLQRAEREKVEGAATAFITGAENILAGIDKLKEAGVPTAAQVKAAIKAELPGLLPDLLGGLVEAEVRKRLEEAAKDKPAT